MLMQSYGLASLRLMLSLASKQRPPFTATHLVLHSELSDWSVLKLQPTRPSPLVTNHDHPFWIHEGAFEMDVEVSTQNHCGC